MLALRVRSCAKNVQLARGYHRFAANNLKTPKMRKEFRLAFVSGLLLATSYVSLTNNNLRSDSLPSQKSAATEQKQYFSVSTNSLDGISSQQNKQGIYLLTDDEVSKRLRQYEESYNVNRGKGVVRYDICQLPSNNPIEDDRSEKIVQVPVQDRENNNARVETDWHFWSIFDGHAGWNTSAKLRDHLLDYVINELDQVYKVSDKNLRLIPSNEAIDKAIKQGFLKLDDELVNKNVQKLLDLPGSKARAAELLMPALSGSCALMSFYDTHSHSLKVAVTGDSRALLGSLDNENHWTVTALSTDQTGSNPTEVAKLLSEHPNEPNVVRNGRVLGSLEPSRAFGDARYKWDKGTQTKVANQFFGRQLPANLKTPPYVTAEPVVTTHEVSPSKHDFLVMASDGLYEMLTNEEIVGLVVRWMENKKMVKPKKSFVDTIWPSSKDKLPLVEDVTDTGSKSKQRLQTKRKSNELGFLLEDENVATHLIRNALSNGGSKEEVNMLVSIPSPLSRRYRDDLTVSVIFFGEGEKHVSNSALEINQEATKGGLTMKAKLSILPEEDGWSAGFAASSGICFPIAVNTSLTLRADFALVSKNNKPSSSAKAWPSSTDTLLRPSISSPVSGSTKRSYLLPTNAITMFFEACSLQWSQIGKSLLSRGIPDFKLDGFGSDGASLSKEGCADRWFFVFLEIVGNEPQNQRRLSHSGFSQKDKFD
ncbi:hypothetical protein OGAPHI_001132 [Ogataea philodendri]|uniref:PPM-type phosphatase domain-containing protein n=1 Tax=Ogataea philodendri TaxID=1378263 RepID=A0A9P8PG29_9ASCO|nr:uncharacterized protein OGAPHI_001132 [Ogataea philodendri]KAH3670617.1 hypothetical protein OGAPHI_001132 [Ogataea philodendri]